MVRRRARKQVGWGLPGLALSMLIDQAIAAGRMPDRNKRKKRQIIRPTRGRNRGRKIVIRSPMFGSSGLTFGRM